MTETRHGAALTVFTAAKLCVATADEGAHSHWLSPQMVPGHVQTHVTLNVSTTVCLSCRSTHTRHAVDALEHGESCHI